MLRDAGLSAPASVSEVRALVPWAVEFRYDDGPDERLDRTAGCKTVTQMRAWIDGLLASQEDAQKKVDKR